jgi:hypothetical protein
MAADHRKAAGWPYLIMKKELATVVHHPVRQLYESKFF